MYDVYDTDYNYSMIQKQIVLDCAPGPIRPGHLLPSVLKGTGIEPVESTSRVFGEWTFNFNHIDDSTWKKARSIFKERIEQLYHRGLIRFGAW